jgi:hypothetical protein
VAADFIAEVEVKEAALAWVPEVMRFASPAPANAGTDKTFPASDELVGDLKGEGAEPVVNRIEEAA